MSSQKHITKNRMEKRLIFERDRYASLRTACDSAWLREDYLQAEQELNAAIEAIQSTNDRPVGGKS